MGSEPPSIYRPIYSEINLITIPGYSLWSSSLKPHMYDLVGGFNPSEKYDFVSWDDDIPKCIEK